MKQAKNGNSPEKGYPLQELETFAMILLSRAGLEMDRARVVAEILLEGDLMGHSTHGLQLLTSYLADLESGAMTRQGDPNTLVDSGSAITWNGQYLPGPWLVTKALDLALERIAKYPVVTLVIQKSHHIGCLAAYPERVTAKGLLLLLTCSDPSVRSVAPFGGIRPLYTPNPIAVGIPTGGEPIIFDISMSSVANGVISRARQQGKKLPGKWVLDNQGEATDDPAVFFADPPGSVLPLGGEQLGYKGFALGLLVEALTAGLGGHGRSDDPDKWGASVFLQIIDPNAFGGSRHFTKEMAWLAEESRNNPVKPGAPPVRLPGSNALRLKKQQLKYGVNLSREIVTALNKLAEHYDIPPLKIIK